ncbi:MAG: hypothetical protein AAGA77_03215 [Bacteroidota bacterium]
MKNLLLLFIIAISFSCGPSEDEGCFSYSENGVKIFEDCDKRTYVVMEDVGATIAWLNNGSEAFVIDFVTELGGKITVVQAGRFDDQTPKTRVDKSFGWRSGFVEWRSDVGDNTYLIEYWNLPNEPE